MSLLGWAEKEIELAMKAEKDASKENDGYCMDGYVKACYDSAFKAFKSLVEDEHSGMSIRITKGILDRLIDGNPLTPITDDKWVDPFTNNAGVTTFQNERMTALFKYVYPDGTVKYSDLDRSYCIDINNGSTYGIGLVRDIVDELYPITLPYFPADNAIKVYCEDFLVDEKNGDFDTVGIFYLIKDGEKIEINRFFKDGNSDENPWEEISREEYEDRKNSIIKRKKMNMSAN